MINVIVAGAAGRMGCRLVALIKDSTTLRLAGAIEGKGHHAVGDDAGETAGCGRAGLQITDDFGALLDRGEVVVDFSAPEATLHHLHTVAQHRRAMVIGTTGFSAPQLEELKSLAYQVPCVLSPNMSVGVNLIYKVISETAIKIAEVLAKAMNRDLDQVGVYARKGLIGERKKGEIGIQAIRAGDIVGDHTILFGGMGERIEVTHRASNRDTFAVGAL